MTIICLIRGCEWSPQPDNELHNPLMLCERCVRCGAQRYLRVS
ncbi:MAG: hypothetical protein PW845_04130 [Pseudomonas sp.]|nr:PSPA7_2676 family Cys-rich small protein [Pseudomonas sp. PIA16]MDE1164572.1 hypothetical protein [Pseudomonas sp.]